MSWKPLPSQSSNSFPLKIMWHVPHRGFSRTSQQEVTLPTSPDCLWRADGSQVVPQPLCTCDCSFHTQQDHCLQVHRHPFHSLGVLSSRCLLGEDDLRTGMDDGPGDFSRAFGRTVLTLWKLKHPGQPESPCLWHQLINTTAMAMSRMGAFWVCANSRPRRNLHWYRESNTCSGHSCLLLLSCASLNPGAEVCGCLFFSGHQLSSKDEKKLGEAKRKSNTTNNKRGEDLLLGRDREAEGENRDWEDTRLQGWDPLGWKAGLFQEICRKKETQTP